MRDYLGLAFICWASIGCALLTNGIVHAAGLTMIVAAIILSQRNP